ncbi:myotilin isoform X1 [Hydra vulgaris]|uniref:myotilin isoform X1 n=1 Tax=Hydra vulgaris TaxID=6087 RepID=UPI000192430D|nr:myotilin [Hydra vulgaris]
MIKLMTDSRELTSYLASYYALTKVEHYTDNNRQKQQARKNTSKWKREHLNPRIVENEVEDDDEAEEDFSYFSKAYLQPRFLTQLPRNLSKTLGEKLEVVCLTSVLFPTEIDWYLNGIVLSNSADGRIVIENNARQLTFVFVKKTDSGKLVCIAKNKFGTDISMCNILVKELK